MRSNDSMGELMKDRESEINVRAQGGDCRCREDLGEKGGAAQEEGSSEKMKERFFKGSLQGQSSKTRTRAPAVVGESEIALGFYTQKGFHY